MVEWFHYDYVYLFYLPIGLGIALAVLRPRAFPLSLLTVAFLVALTASWAPGRDKSRAVEALDVALFLGVPGVVVLALSRARIYARARWLLVPSALLAWWLGYVVGVNIWLALGNHP
jgi:hypothetical protein